jgi:hypothetical protein
VHGAAMVLAHHCLIMVQALRDASCADLDVVHIPCAASLALTQAEREAHHAWSSVVSAVEDLALQGVR